MSEPRNPARRAFLLLASTIAAGLLTSPRANAQRGGDNGIGGTGYAPPVSERDNGLGGTGVVGTIRRFGSIYVNDARIAYPRDTSVTIDGRAARASDLRIGHVVTLLAQGPQNGLATRAIAVTHEVIGPVEAVENGRATVLGQEVILPKAAKVKTGQTIAVSGLRTPDQTIVASLIEKAPAGVAMVTGVVDQNAQGGLVVGNLAVRGLPSEVMGQRTRVTGAIQDGAFVSSAAEPVATAPPGAKKLLLEAYARSDNGAVTTPGGFSAIIDRGVKMLNGATRVVLSADRDESGGWIVRSTRMIRAAPGMAPSTLPGAPGGPGAAAGQNLPGWQGGPGWKGGGGPAGGGAPQGSGGPGLPGWPGGQGGAGTGGTGPGGAGPGGMGPGGFGGGGFGGGGFGGGGGGGPPGGRR